MTSRISKKNVVVELRGGLGNQMFQYAAARSLALDLNADVKIDRKLGFVLDFQYKRSFELHKFPISYSDSSLVSSLPFYINRISSFMVRKMGTKEFNWNETKYIFERNLSYLEVDVDKLKGNIFWLSGYFQDPRYFSRNKKRIMEELMPPLPIENSFLELGGLSKNRSLIAMGFRMFEESKFPENHARNGVQKTFEDYKQALSKFLSTISNPLVLVFTTREFDFLHSLNLPCETILVNSDRFPNNSLDVLWLLTKCQHHIFNNSTFYWWGAALSQLNYRNSIQEIYCSDNFLNPNICYPNWKTF